MPVMARRGMALQQMNTDGVHSCGSGKPEWAAWSLGGWLPQSGLSKFGPHTPNHSSVLSSEGAEVRPTW